MKNIVVIKCGGSTLNQLSDDFFYSIKQLKELGKFPVIVHGGGPEIETMLNALNIKFQFVNGLRKTTSEVMDIVEMVLAGKVNKWLVSKLQYVGIEAIGLSGRDGSLLKVSAKNKQQLGFVGEVKNVNIDFLEKLVSMDLVPVIAPIGEGKRGERFNINADSVAGAIAISLKAEQLLFVTDVPGIIKENQLMEELTVSQVQHLLHEGIIYGGMIPKVEAALKSLESDLNEVMIVNGNSTKLVQQGKIMGTKIRKDSITATV